ncbi:MAG TPA: hypothetical protein VK587_01015, partial [bacterium]|nr:hypothetical protein [bacterium]
MAAAHPGRARTPAQEVGSEGEALARTTGRRLAAGTRRRERPAARGRSAAHGRETPARKRRPQRDAEDAEMDERIRIFDTTLRDGEQSPGFTMN